jgi:hypothetical protein
LPAAAAGDGSTPRRPAIDGNDPALARLLAVWPSLTPFDRESLAEDAERLAGGG